MSEAPRIDPKHVRAVRLGHGANCSSIGSVIDTLFLTAAVGGALVAALCAAIEDREVEIVGEDEATSTGEEEGSA